MESLKIGDTVEIISGSDYGKVGKVDKLYSLHNEITVVIKWAKNNIGAYRRADVRLIKS